MAQVLAYPFPSDLVSLRSGNAFAWVSDDRGVRNIWAAQGPDYKARRVIERWDAASNRPGRRSCRIS